MGSQAFLDITGRTGNLQYLSKLQMHIISDPMYLYTRIINCTQRSAVALLIVANVHKQCEHLLLRLVKGEG